MTHPDTTFSGWLTVDAPFLERPGDHTVPIVTFYAQVKPVDGKLEVEWSKVSIDDDRGLRPWDFTTDIPAPLWSRMQRAGRAAFRAYATNP